MPLSANKTNTQPDSFPSHTGSRTHIPTQDTLCVPIIYYYYDSRSDIFREEDTDIAIHMITCIMIIRVSSTGQWDDFPRDT